MALLAASRDGRKWKPSARRCSIAPLLGSQTFNVVHFTEKRSNRFYPIRSGRGEDFLKVMGAVTWFGLVQISHPLRRRLAFFGCLCRPDTSQDHSRALQACIRGPPKDWRCRTGRPRQTWLRTVEDDLRPLNFGLATALRRALDRSTWRQLMEVAIRLRDMLLREWVPCSFVAQAGAHLPV